MRRMCYTCLVIVLLSSSTSAQYWGSRNARKLTGVPVTAPVAGDNGKCLSYELATSSLKWVACDGVIGNEVLNVSNSTLELDGTGTAGDPYTVGLNLANANTWSAAQTFCSTSSSTMQAWFTEESITLSTSGLTTDSTANLLPADSEILAVTARVTTTITTTTSWSLGDATTAARFLTATTDLTSGTTKVGLNHRQGSISTNATGPVQTTAAKLRITCSGANPGAGVVKVVVWWRKFVAPTS